MLYKLLLLRKTFLLLLLMLLMFTIGEIVGGDDVPVVVAVVVGVAIDGVVAEKQRVVVVEDLVDVVAVVEGRVDSVVKLKMHLSLKLLKPLNENATNRKEQKIFGEV